MIEGRGVLFKGHRLLWLPGSGAGIQPRYHSLDWFVPLTRFDTCWPASVFSVTWIPRNLRFHAWWLCPPGRRSRLWIWGRVPGLAGQIIAGHRWQLWGPEATVTVPFKLVNLKTGLEDWSWRLVFYIPVCYSDFHAGHWARPCGHWNNLKTLRPHTGKRCSRTAGHLAVPHS